MRRGLSTSPNLAQLSTEGVHLSPAAQGFVNRRLPRTRGRRSLCLCGRHLRLARAQRAPQRRG